MFFKLDTSIILPLKIISYKYLLIKSIVNCLLILNHPYLRILYLFFSKKGFHVKSYGSGTHVKLPGPSPDKPNIYDFNTTYDQMYRDLMMKDRNLYPWFNKKSLLCSLAVVKQ